MQVYRLAKSDYVIDQCRVDGEISNRHEPLFRHMVQTFIPWPNTIQSFSILTARW